MNSPNFEHSPASLHEEVGRGLKESPFCRGGGLGCSRQSSSPPFDHHVCVVTVPSPRRQLARHANKRSFDQHREDVVCSLCGRRGRAPRAPSFGVLQAGQGKARILEHCIKCRQLSLNVNPQGNYAGICCSNAHLVICSQLTINDRADCTGLSSKQLVRF